MKLNGLKGFLVDAPSYGAVRGVRDGAVVFDDVGTIVRVGTAAEVGEGVEWIDCGAEVPVVVPGLVDVHAHLPQYPAVARTEEGLLPWLNRHIFPLERGFRGEVVRPLADAFFSDLVANGTTTSVIYTAVWEESCSGAFEAAEAAGVRAVIGKVMMDEGTYGDLEPEATRELSLEETERLCARWHGAAGGRLEYAVSPRFAVTCSGELMRGAAEIARKYGAYVQTHLSENLREIELVGERFPESVDYTDVYDGVGLLGEKTILGHCIHLSGRETGVLASRGAKVAHCPTSNFFLGSGVMPLDRILGAGLTVGLGSDVAGGPELNLWQVMREAVNGQKARGFFEEGVRALSTGEAFYLGTMGGAEVLGKGAVIGSLDAGKEADLVVMDLAAVLPYGGACSDVGAMPAEAVVDALVYRGGPGAVCGVFVRGRPILANSGSGR